MGEILQPKQEPRMNSKEQATNVRHRKTMNKGREFEGTLCITFHIQVLRSNCKLPRASKGLICIVHPVMADIWAKITFSKATYRLFLIPKPIPVFSIPYYAVTSKMPWQMFTLSPPGLSRRS
jgi:hypothetical protein